MDNNSTNLLELLCGPTELSVKHSKQCLIDINCDKSVCKIKYKEFFFPGLNDLVYIYIYIYSGE